MKSFGEFLAESMNNIHWARTKEHAEERWRFDGMTVVDLDVDKIIRGSDDYMPKTCFDDGKMHRLEAYVATDGWLDPPQVSWSEYTKKIQISNGRHRVWLAKKMGIKKIPCIIMPEQKTFLTKNYG